MFMWSIISNNPSKEDENNIDLGAPCQSSSYQTGLG
jgi:hypothetical protein